MEELIPSLSDMLNKTVEFREDKNRLLIELEVKEKNLIPGDLGKPHEVKEMITIFGGIKKEISMEIDINENTNVITIKLLTLEDFETISAAMKDIWEKVSELLIRALNIEPGKLDEFKDLGNFSNKY
jgi:hypothetical protein